MTGRTTTAPRSIAAELRTLIEGAARGVDGIIPADVSSRTSQLLREEAERQNVDYTELARRADVTTRTVQEYLGYGIPQKPRARIGGNKPVLARIMMGLGADHHEAIHVESLYYDPQAPTMIGLDPEVVAKEFLALSTGLELTGRSKLPIELSRAAGDKILELMARCEMSFEEMEERSGVRELALRNWTMRYGVPRLMQPNADFRKVIMALGATRDGADQVIMEYYGRTVDDQAQPMSRGGRRGRKRGSIMPSESDHALVVVRDEHALKLFEKGLSLIEVKAEVNAHLRLRLHITAEELHEMLKELMDSDPDRSLRISVARKITVLGKQIESEEADVERRKRALESKKAELASLKEIYR